MVTFDSARKLCNASSPNEDFNREKYKEECSKFDNFHTYFKQLSRISILRGYGVILGGEKDGEKMLWQLFGFWERNNNVLFESIWTELFSFFFFVELSVRTRLIEKGKHIKKICFFFLFLCSIILYYYVFWI